MNKNNEYILSQSTLSLFSKRPTLLSAVTLFFLHHVHKILQVKTKSLSYITHITVNSVVPLCMPAGHSECAVAECALSGRNIVYMSINT